MAPVGLVLLFLTGVGPLLAWRKSTLSNCETAVHVAGVVGCGGWLGLAVLGVRFWASGLCFALCGFVTGTIAQEFWRGGLVRRKNTGSDFLTALIGLVARNKRRYGGYIVHVGVVLIFLGFAGNDYKRDAQVLLKLGEQTTLGRYTLRNDGVKVSDDGQKQMATAYISVFEGGKQIDTMYPARWFFRKHEQEPTTEVAIRRTFAEDLYLVFAFDRQQLGSQSATLQIVVNPLVNWIWLGFGIIALGTGIALLPERATRSPWRNWGPRRRQRRRRCRSCWWRSQRHRHSHSMEKAATKACKAPSTRATSWSDSCGMKSSARAVPAATPASANAARILAPFRTSCGASWPR